MKVRDLMEKLATFPKDMDVIVQSRSDGEWGSFSARSHVKSVVRRKIDDDSAVVIRADDKWLSSGGFS